MALKALARLALGVMALSWSLALAQKTYNRACECDYMVNGKCAYTLMLPNPCPSGNCGGGGDGGMSSEDSAYMQQQLYDVSNNLTELTSTTGDQAKSLIRVQNDIETMNTMISSLSVQITNSVPDCCTELSQSATDTTASLSGLITQVSNLESSHNSLKTSFETFERQQNIFWPELVDKTEELENDIEKVERNIERIEDDIRALLDEPAICLQKGLVVSGDKVAVQDSAITASSELDETTGAARVRIQTVAEEGLAGSWCTQDGAGEDYIEFILSEKQKIQGVITKGRPETEQWVTSYKLQYIDFDSGRATEWHTYTDVLGDDVIFDGNADHSSSKTNWLPQPIATKFIRIIPLTANDGGGVKCMRADIIGCV